MIKVAVKILPRPEVLDTQGRAVSEILNKQGHELHQCQVGRYVVLEMEESSKEEALKKANAMAEKVLHNPLIEVFEAEVL